MYGKLVNGELVLAPKTYTSSSGIVISNFDLQVDMMKDFGYKEIIDNKVVSEYDLIEIYEESEDTIVINYIVNNTDEYICDLKLKLIEDSKINLGKYLKSNPLESTCKYEQGRVYTITIDKQNQLTSVITHFLSEAIPYVLLSICGGEIVTSIEDYLLKMNDMPIKIYWNDEGEMCEEWNYSQITQLKNEMTEMVTPIVEYQRFIEVELNKLTTQEDLKSFDLEFTKEKIDKFIEMKQVIM